VKRAELKEQEDAYNAEIAAERKQARLEGRTGEQIEQAEVAVQGEAQGEITAGNS